MFGKYHLIGITAIGVTYSTICLLNGLSPFFLFKSIIKEDKISKKTKKNKKTKKCKSKQCNKTCNDDIYEYINNLNLNKMSKQELIELKELLRELN